MHGVMSWLFGQTEKIKENIRIADLRTDITNRDLMSNNAELPTT